MSSPARGTPPAGLKSVTHEVGLLQSFVVPVQVETTGLRLHQGTRFSRHLNPLIWSFLELLVLPVTTKFSSYLTRLSFQLLPVTQSARFVQSSVLFGMKTLCQLVLVWSKSQEVKKSMDSLLSTYGRLNSTYLSLGYQIVEISILIFVISS